MTYLYIAIAIATLLGIIGFVLHKRNPPKKTLLLDEKPRELSEAEKRRERSKKIWDEANIGDIVLFTIPGDHKQRVIVKVVLSESDYKSILDSYLEVYNPNDESHRGVVADRWLFFAKKARNNQNVEGDSTYWAVLGEISSWQVWEKMRLKEKVLAEIPRRPGETLPTDFFEKLFDVPKVVKATTTSIQLAREG